MNFSSKIMMGAMVMASSSFALVGFGGHFAPTMGTEINASKEVIVENKTDAAKPLLTMNRGKLENLSGFGVKLWIDALPFVDLEATGNFAFGSYSASLGNGFTTDTVALQAKMGYMGVEKTARPIAFMGSGDLSVLYPFLKLPPMISILKVYAGAGVSYKFNSVILSKSLVEKAAAAEIAKLSGNNGGGLGDVNSVATAVVKELAKSGIESGMGAHLVLGAKAKLPVIPIAAYANYKYYLGGVKSPLNAGSVFELGGGIAF